MGALRYSRSGAPRCSSSARPWRLLRPVSGRTSAPPSPYFVKNPVTASAAWSVPITSRRACPARAYWATMRERALTLPLVKSVIACPAASAYSAWKPSTARLMSKTTLDFGWMKESASCASSSSACTPYGRRTATNSARSPSDASSSIASWARRPARDESCPPLTPRTKPSAPVDLR